MINSINRKYNNYIYYPDLSNKFLISSFDNIISPEKFNVYLKYIFSQRRNYGYVALKALMMLTSIFPKRCLISSQLIILKYSKIRCHSIIYLKLNLTDYVSTMQYFIKKPTFSNIVINGHVKESKYFVFPGFVKHLRLPRWERFVNVSYNQVSKECLYPFFFYKTSFID
jgi:hypothetical protein